MEKMSNFKLERISDIYPDCMADFDVIIDVKITLQQFIDIVLYQRKKEWGTISVNDKTLKYNCGNIENDVSDIFSDKELNSFIFDVTAYGGYSLMNYKIML